MKTSFRKYTRNSVIVTIIIGALCYAISFFLPENFISPALPYLILFFFAVNLIVHFMLQRAEENQFRKFITNYMLATFLRFFLYLMVIIAYVLINRSDAVPFIVSFFILYLVYSIHEVISILPRSKA